MTNNDPERYNSTLNRTLDTESLVGVGKMLSNCQDLAVYDKNESEYLNFNFTSCNTTTTNIYFKIINFTATTTKEICYRYDDAGASDNSSLWRDVYQEYDNFNDNSINTTIWNRTGTEITEGGGVLNVYNSDASWSDDFITTLRTFDTPVIVEFRYNRQLSEYNELALGENNFMVSKQNGSRFFLNGEHDKYYLHFNKNGVLLTNKEGSDNTVGTWYNGSLRVNSTYLDMTVNGSIDNSDTQTIDFPAYPVVMGGYDMHGDNSNMSVDDFRVSTWFTIEPTYGGFKGEVSIEEDGSPSITIVSPPNITYYTRSIVLNFTATDDTLTTFPCWYLIDGTPTSIGNLTNNTYYNTTLSLNGAHYNLTVYCEDPGVGQNGSATVFFHVFSGFNVSVYDNDTNASMTDWTICFENSTDQDCSADQNNSVLFEWDTIPQGSVNITISDGSATLYYFNSTYARTNNESNYENLSLYLEPKDANILTLTSSAGWNIAGETETTITCTASEDTPSQYRDGVGVSNPYTATLAFGTYNFTCLIAETTNYAPASTTTYLNVVSGGFGCTDNETFAFELNLTITPGTNQTILNFTSLVNNHFVRSDLNDVLPITSNSPRGWRNTTGYYYIANVTGLTNLTVRFGNAIADYNWTTEGNTTGITGFTYSEINPYIRLTFINERNGSVMLPPESNRTLTLYCAEGISAHNISETRMLVATKSQADELNVKIDYSVTEIYRRNYVIDADVENINAYLVDANVDQVVELQILLQDATGDFDESLLKAKKYVEGNLWTMTEHYFDAEGKVIVYLINGDKYSIYVDNSEEERSIGDLYIDTVDLTKTLTLGEILTTNQTLGNNTFGLYNTSDSIVFSYIDYSGLTISAEMWVLNWTNTSQQFYYTNSTNRSRIQFTYQVPDVNQTYLVHVVVHHETYGENSLDLWMSIFEAARSIPHPLEPLSSMFGDIEGITWQNLVGVFAVIGAAMLFTASSGGIAGSFAVITGAVLFMFGWWGANIAILAVAFVLSILNKLTEKRRES